MFEIASGNYIGCKIYLLKKDDNTYVVKVRYKGINTNKPTFYREFNDFNSAKTMFLVANKTITDGLTD